VEELQFDFVVLEVTLNQEDIYAAHMANGQFEVRLLAVHGSMLKKRVTISLFFFVEDGLAVPLPPLLLLHLWLSRKLTAVISHCNCYSFDTAVLQHRTLKENSKLRNSLSLL
jgi:hypothetical protein